MENSIPFPLRINRYLALHGHATRRGADKLIRAGQVRINDRPALLGDIVKAGDRVSVRNLSPRADSLYLAYHKPRGVVTYGPQGREKDIRMMIGRDDVFPIGRLDKHSHGLIILTNDGRITGPLLDPKSNHEKEYIVSVDKTVTARFLKNMARGINIEGYVTKPAVTQQRSERGFSIILTEGKTHQIRRMCAALGYVVRDLKRIRIMNIKLTRLKENEYREITGRGRILFLKKLGFDDKAT